MYVCSWIQRAIGIAKSNGKLPSTPVDREEVELHERLASGELLLLLSRCCVTHKLLCTAALSYCGGDRKYHDLIPLEPGTPPDTSHHAASKAANPDLRGERPRKRPTKSWQLQQRLQPTLLDPMVLALQDTYHPAGLRAATPVKVPPFPDDPELDRLVTQHEHAFGPSHHKYTVQ